MAPMGLTRYRLAREIGVPAPRIGDMVRGGRSVTADSDLRLCRSFGLPDGCWLRAHAACDIEGARCELSPELKKFRPWAGTAA
jgi:addiction module HigA family antidote